ncbi:TKL family protein kinase [Trichomonas vaginalis G3]|uniref:TKL family protein kinase n=1 Tax=Trichomonas vaginalis (strain ATCC PRA-98 / G3) TaxID=412133 RepID=A2FEP9_TRIV3|nr:protein kinase protein [Trichomonas vaginalis G3]EAX96629.1 TKL family protein kinase [Trichomonas vaginalis G3]KAI5532898.1 protein kinase protein [Trichomonas vaginalis G3]|eukprot:XP_001309559.1 TKL family protein kinase [Trichomonas vaginalis G3]
MFPEKSGDQLFQCVKVANNIFLMAQDTIVYRASIAYILQQIRSFLSAIQPLKNKSLNQSEIVALERFTGLVAHFSTVIPNLGSNWIRTCLNWPTTHVHEYIDNFRKSLIEICQLLSLDPDKVLQYDQIQDTVNKIADFQHLKQALTEVQQKSISIENAVDVQQLIETRLYSINRHLPKKNQDTVGMHHPTTEGAPMEQIRFRMDDALNQFRSIDIPCEDIIVGKTLGSGGFGTVFMGTRISTGELIAVKEVRSDKLSISTWASLYSEVANMANLKNRYVLELVGAHIKEPYRIITRFCPGRSLFDRIHRCPQHPLPPARLTALAYQVASGMAFLHSNGIVHRDLKTMNILLDESDAARIADFGLSGNMRDNKDLYGTLGTPHYTAPEVLARKRYGPKVDSYSFGIVLWEMETGLIPFREKTHKEIIDHVVNRGWRLPLSRTVPDSLRRLITRCWSENPAERPEFEEIVALFKKGEVYFGTPNDRVQLEAGKDYPPIDKDHTVRVLTEPNNPAFSTLVDFFVDNVSPSLLDRIRTSRIVDNYTKDSVHPDKVLLASSKLLQPDEFPKFIQNVGGPIIEMILAKGTPAQITAAIRFCISVPSPHTSLVSKYTKTFVSKLDDQSIAPYVLRLVAAGGEGEVQKYQKQLVDFFSKPTSIVETQETLNAITYIIPFIANQLKNIANLLSLLDVSLSVPENFAQFLVDNLNPDKVTDLVTSLISAAEKSDISKPLCTAINKCTDKQIETLADDNRILDHIQGLLSSGKCVQTALLLLFRMANIPTIAPRLANHPALAALFEVKTFTGQRLQILTALVLCKQFVLDTAMMNDILKILVSSLSIDSLQKYALLLVGALSNSSEGCTILQEAGLLGVFSQLFLSPVCNNQYVALTILRNCALQNANISQKSLIISCLMQDLSSAVKGRTTILWTLIALLSQSPTCVQEQDIQNAVLPLLSERQGPVVITLCLKLLDACDMKKLRLIYRQILNRIYLILANDLLLIPDLIAAAVQLIMSLWTMYKPEVVQFVRDSDFIAFLSGIIPMMSDFPEPQRSIQTSLFLLSQSSFDSQEEYHSPASGNASMTQRKQSQFVLEDD